MNELIIRGTIKENGNKLVNQWVKERVNLNLNVFISVSWDDTSILKTIVQNKLAS